MFPRTGVNVYGDLRRHFVREDTVSQFPLRFYRLEEFASHRSTSLFDEGTSVYLHEIDQRGPYELRNVTSNGPDSRSELEGTHQLKI